MPSSSGSPEASLKIVCTGDRLRVSTNQAGGFISLRANINYVAAAQFFRSMVLTKITLRVTQLQVPSTKDAYDISFWRYGVVPRDLPTYRPDTGDTSIHQIPHLIPFNTTTSGASSETTWGEGGIPFPPSIQLELRALEFDDTYATAFIGNVDDKSTTTHPVMIEATYEVMCSRQGFGAPYDYFLNPPQKPDTNVKQSDSKPRAIQSSSESSKKSSDKPAKVST